MNRNNLNSVMASLSTVGDPKDHVAAIAVVLRLLAETIYWGWEKEPIHKYRDFLFHDFEIDFFFCSKTLTLKKKPNFGFV